jgi:dihydroxy-acid dehydratase
MMMAAARLGLASVFVYAGTSLPGRTTMPDGTDRELTIVDAFETIGACRYGLATADDLTRIERSFCPGIGGCAGMYSANTMASMAETLGLALPGSASPPAVDRRRTTIHQRPFRELVVDNSRSRRRWPTLLAVAGLLMVTGCRATPTPRSST